MPSVLLPDPHLLFGGYRQNETPPTPPAGSSGSVVALVCAARMSPKTLFPLRARGSRALPVVRGKIAGLRRLKSKQPPPQARPVMELVQSAASSSMGQISARRPSSVDNTPAAIRRRFKETFTKRGTIRRNKATVEGRLVSPPVVVANTGAEAVEEVAPKTATTGCTENKLSRARALEASKRLARHGELASARPSSTAKSALELLKLAGPTRLDYKNRLDSLDAWRRDQNLDDPICIDGLGLLLLERLDWMFFEGLLVGEGDKLVASISFFFPKLKSHPEWPVRLKAALAGWNRRAPGRSMAPLPINAVYAIVGALLHLRRFWSAAFVVLQFITYMRPGEVESLKVSQIIAPRLVSGMHPSWAVVIAPLEAPAPAKSGVREETMLVDLAEHSWVGPLILHPLTTGRHPDDLVFQVSNADLLKDWREALQVLGWQELDLSRYCIRHSGASADLAAQTRTMAEVKVRGRWIADSSMKRYLKVGRAMALSHELSDATLQFGGEVRKKAEALFSGALAPLRPP